MITFSRDLYSLIFVGLVLGIAGIVVYDDPSIVPIASLILIAASFVFCAKMCRSEDYGYMEGLSSISRKHSSGCANLTIIYLMPVLFLVHVVCVGLSFMGLVKGRDFTANTWHRLTFVA